MKTTYTMLEISPDCQKPAQFETPGWKEKNLNFKMNAKNTWNSNTQMAKRHKSGLNWLNGPSDLHIMQARWRKMENLYFRGKIHKTKWAKMSQNASNAFKCFRKTIILDQNGQKTSKSMQTYRQNALTLIKMATDTSIPGTQILKKCISTFNLSFSITERKYSRLWLTYLKNRSSRQVMTERTFEDKLTHRP